MDRRLICALDYADLDEALTVLDRVKPYVGAFKIGHGLVLQHGLEVIGKIRDHGVERVFLDLKFHDIPNSVALAVRHAARYGVWMMTLHISGGPAMITAAVEEAKTCREDEAPLLVGVSVLTSLDQHVLRDHLGVSRTLETQVESLSRLGTECGLDGVVCSVHEARAIREAVGHKIIVTPGIRPSSGETEDQARVGDGRCAIEAGADYLVIGRALTSSSDPARALAAMGLEPSGFPA
ncbi:MAG: orotidine-5'-phosphate decarboxylase [Fimbriimonadaceae bacterium]|nr:orotidine-5'-phosphate decarboxylase [Fimbriimonadaceae bacterium]